MEGQTDITNRFGTSRIKLVKNEITEVAENYPSSARLNIMYKQYKSCIKGVQRCAKQLSISKVILFDLRKRRNLGTLRRRSNLSLIHDC